MPGMPRRSMVASTRDGRASEPEHFIEFAERIPEWCVVVGLIGGGQEIHVGEEAGLGQWRAAVEAAALTIGSSTDPQAPQQLFDGYDLFHSSVSLHLNEEIRFHLATDIDRFVRGLLGEDDDAPLASLAGSLEIESLPPPDHAGSGCGQAVPVGSIWRRSGGTLRACGLVSRQGPVAVWYLATTGTRPSLSAMGRGS